MNFSIQRNIRLAAPLIIAVLALNLAASVRAADQKTPLHGSFHSAKDPNLPPLPFNPHPELEVVEVEKGVFVVDDTGIPDTPEQGASRKARQAAQERAKAIASNPILAQAAKAAQQAAQEATWEKNRQEIAPWLVSPLPPAQGEPASLLSVEAGAQSELLTLAAQFNEAQEALVQTASNTGTPMELVFPNGD